MDAESISQVIEDICRGVADLATRPDEEKQGVLRSLLAQVRLGYDSPITLVFWLDEMVSRIEAVRNGEAQSPTPTEVSLSGPVSDASLPHCR